MPGTILIVDDDPHQLANLQALLAGAGHRVILANSGEQALGILEYESIDALMTDEHMPGLQGTQLLRVAVKRHPSTIRILVTARPSLESSLRAINEGGVFRYLQKPVDAATILLVADEALAQRERVWKDLELRRIAEAEATLAQFSRNDRAPKTSRPVVNEGSPIEDGLNNLRDGIGSTLWDELSPREREILAGLVEGKKVPQLAREHSISPHTVRNHIKSVYKKTDVHSQAELLTKYFNAAIARSA